MIDLFKWKNGKMIIPKKFMGLAIEDGDILAADIRCDRELFHVERTARLVYPEGVSFDKPGAMGELLGQFIRENQFAARKAVIGLPAKWLMFRVKSVPPSTEESVAGALKIHAEREFSLDADNLVIDYTGEVSAEKPNRLLLAAVMRKRMDRVVETVRSAGLEVLSVTVSSMALSLVVFRHMLRPRPRYFLYLRQAFAELLVIEDGHVVDLRHLQRDTRSGTRSLILEVRRILSLYYGNSAENEKEDLMIWNASDLDEREFDDIKSSLSSQANIINCDERKIVKKLGLTGRDEAHSVAVPAALGRALIDGGPFYIDFINSRMNAKLSRIKSIHIKWASAIISVLIIIILGVFFSWKMDRRDVIELRSKLEGMRDDISAAQNIVRKVNIARSWYSGRPDILNCIRELTMGFPEEGRVWATNLALNEEMRGIISGKAVDEKSVIEVLDKLKKNSLFSDVQMIYMRDSGRNSQEISFSINFSFTGGE